MKKTLSFVAPSHPIATANCGYSTWSGLKTHDSLVIICQSKGFYQQIDTYHFSFSFIEKKCHVCMGS